MNRRPIPKFETATIYVCNGVAYLPTQNRYETEQAVDINPVYVCDLHQSQIVGVLEKILNTQKVRLPKPESMTYIYQQASKVILNATKKRSWMQLAKDCCVYMVTWRQEETIISASQLDKNGRFEFPTSLQKRYPSNTTLGELVNIILDDLKTRNKVD
jgi:hypothetical protein